MSACACAHTPVSELMNWLATFTQPFLQQGHKSLTCPFCCDVVI